MTRRNFWMIYACFWCLVINAINLSGLPFAYAQHRKPSLKDEAATAPVAGKLTSDDAIVSCLQREGVLVYAVTDKGPPKIGQPVTADMFAVICVEEKR